MLYITRTIQNKKTNNFKIIASTKQKRAKTKQLIGKNKGQIILKYKVVKGLKGSHFYARNY